MWKKEASKECKSKKKNTPSKKITQTQIHKYTLTKNNQTNKMKYNSQAPNQDEMKNHNKSNGATS